MKEFKFSCFPVGRSSKSWFAAGECAAYHKNNRTTFVNFFYSNYENGYTSQYLRIYSGNWQFNRLL